MALPRKRKKLEASSDKAKASEEKQEAPTPSETSPDAPIPGETQKKSRRTRSKKAVTTTKRAKLDDEFDLVEKLEEDVSTSGETTIPSGQHRAASSEEIMKTDLLPDEEGRRSVQASIITQKHMMLASSAALIPAPFVDIFLTTGVQVRLVGQLAELYEKDFSIARTKYLIAALGGNYAVGISSLWGGLSLAKAFPGLGVVVGSATMPVVMGASTYAIGRIFSHHFSLDGELTNFKPAKNRKYFQEQFKEGKQLVAGLSHG